jgi:hypothetical protein
MQPEMDAVFNGFPALAAGGPRIGCHFEEIRRMPLIDFSVKLVMNQRLFRNPPALHHYPANDRRQVCKGMLDDTKAAKSRLHRLHEAGANETRIEGPDGWPFPKLAHFPGRAQSFEETKKGAIVRQSRVHGAQNLFVAAMFLHDVMHQSLP